MDDQVHDGDARLAADGLDSRAASVSTTGDGHVLDSGESRGPLMSGISTGFVRLLKESYGRGPEKARTTYDGDLVVVLMRGGFTRVEQTLLDAGRGDSVIQQRMDFQDVMREKFNEVIEHHTGRKVIAFMSGSHQDPDLIAEVFVLEAPGRELLADAQAGDGDDGDGQPAS